MDCLNCNRRLFTRYILPIRVTIDNNGVSVQAGTPPSNLLDYWYNPLPMNIRYSFLKDGIASPWIEKDEKQVAAIARKHFGCSYALWNWLKGQGRVRKQVQHLKGGVWI